MFDARPELDLSVADIPTERTARPLIVDSFAGGGGASTGIEAALGRAPDVAINHSPEALALHAANHPNTDHLITSVYRVDPRDVVKPGQRVGLAWFSPDCKHFSKAKGGQPLNKNIRDLAWVVVHWAELVAPEVILLENVEEFVTWGPLRQRHEGGRPWTGTLTADLWDAAPPEVKGRPVYNSDGTPWMEPDPLRKGQTFNEWVRALRRLGYRVEWRELRACDYGAPTIRKRLFVVARRDGRPIVWPEPTHGAPDSDGVREGRLKPWRAAAECIDWTIPCPSIFATSGEIMAGHGVRAVRPLAAATLARIARGMKRYVLEAEDPFIVNTTGHAGYTGSEPTATVTTGGHHALVAPSLMRHFGTSTGQAVTAPVGTIMPDGQGKTAIIAPVLTYAQHGGANRDMRDPHHTICANYKDQNAIIAPHLLSVAHGDSGGRREYPVGEVYHTVTAGGITHALAAATLVQTGYGERSGQAPRALDIGQPLGTIVAGGAKHASAVAFLAQQNTGLVGRDARAPLSTIVGLGSTQTPVAAWFAKYYGTGDGARMDTPCHAVTTRDRFGHMQAALSAPPFTLAHAARARQVADFLRAHDAWDGGDVVTLEVGGDTFAVVDIGMRMLTPRELFRAQGFPDDYVIEGVWDEDGGDWSFRAFPKNVQVSCCGNSVSPPVAEALVAANCAHLIDAVLDDGQATP